MDRYQKFSRQVIEHIKPFSRQVIEYIRPWNRYEKFCAQAIKRAIEEFEAQDRVNNRQVYKLVVHREKHITNYLSDLYNVEDLTPKAKKGRTKFLFDFMVTMEWIKQNGDVAPLGIQLATKKWWQKEPIIAGVLISSCTAIFIKVLEYLL